MSRKSKYIYIYNVGKTIINHSCGNCLYNLFLVIWGINHWWIIQMFITIDIHVLMVYTIYIMVFMIVLPTNKVDFPWPSLTTGYCIATWPLRWSPGSWWMCAQLVKNPLIATWKIYFPWKKSAFMENLWLDYNGKSINVVDDTNWRFP